MSAMMNFSVREFINHKHDYKRSLIRGIKKIIDSELIYKKKTHQR